MSHPPAGPSPDSPPPGPKSLGYPQPRPVPDTPPPPPTPRGQFAVVDVPLVDVCAPFGHTGGLCGYGATP